MMCAFPWDNHSDQCASKKPMNSAGPSFDAPRSEWSWINNTNIDQLKGDQGFFPLWQRFEEISVEIQMERPVSVSSDRNIRDHFWRWSLISVGTFGVTFLTIRRRFFALFREFVVLSIMPKISEFSVGIQMERFVSVSSDRKILDHLWKWFTYFSCNLPFQFWQTLITEKEKNMDWQEPFGCPGLIIVNYGLIGKCRSIFLRYSHWSLTSRFGRMESTFGKDTKNGKSHFYWLAQFTVIGKNCSIFLGYLHWTHWSLTGRFAKWKAPLVPPGFQFLGPTLFCSAEEHRRDARVPLTTSNPVVSNK